MRRRDPRPLAAALAPLHDQLAPATTLARVQEAWPRVAGELAASEAEPVSERSGKVTFACRSSVWASELALMAPELQRRLNEALGGDQLSSLRFVTGSRGEAA